MLRLIWKRKNDPQQYGSVIGDAESIRDLYWQLTHNYQPQDGTAIGDIIVKSLDGITVSRKELLQTPHACAKTENLYT